VFFFPAKNCRNPGSFRNRTLFRQFAAGICVGLKKKFLSVSLLPEALLASKKVYFRQGCCRNVILVKSGDFSNS
jgi:hypothetical protein